MTSVDTLLLVYRRSRPLKGLSRCSGFHVIPLFFIPEQRCASNYPQNSCSCRKQAYFALCLKPSAKMPGFGFLLLMKMLLLDQMFEREHKHTPQRANIQELCVLVQTVFRKS